MGFNTSVDKSDAARSPAVLPAPLRPPLPPPAVLPPTLRILGAPEADDSPRITSGSTASPLPVLGCEPLKTENSSASSSATSPSSTSPSSVVSAPEGAADGAPLPRSPSRGFGFEESVPLTVVVAAAGGATTLWPSPPTEGPLVDAEAVDAARGRRDRSRRNTSATGDATTNLWDTHPNSASNDRSSRHDWERDRRCRAPTTALRKSTDPPAQRRQLGHTVLLGGQHKMG